MTRVRLSEINPAKGTLLHFAHDELVPEAKVPFKQQVATMTPGQFCPWFRCTLTANVLLNVTPFAAIPSFHQIL